MSIKTMLAEKQEWRNLEKRVKAMTADYQFVYKQMKTYIFKVTILDSQQMFELFEEIITLFEQGTENGLDVLDITGRDVATFCDQLTIDKQSHLDSVQREVEESIRQALLKVK